MSVLFNTDEEDALLLRYDPSQRAAILRDREEHDDAEDPYEAADAIDRHTDVTGNYDGLTEEQHANLASGGKTHHGQGNPRDPPGVRAQAIGKIATANYRKEFREASSLYDTALHACLSIHKRMHKHSIKDMFLPEHRNHLVSFLLGVPLGIFLPKEGTFIVGRSREFRTILFRALTSHKWHYQITYIADHNKLRYTLYRIDTTVNVMRQVRNRGSRGNANGALRFVDGVPVFYDVYHMSQIVTNTTYLSSPVPAGVFPELKEDKALRADSRIAIQERRKPPSTK
jgi:hypothetical protein